jgi:ABC-type multidrug transport system permease subunit
MKKRIYAILVIATMIYCSLLVTAFAICMLIGIVSNQVTIDTNLAIFVNILIGICAYFVWYFTICITKEYYKELWRY